LKQIIYQMQVREIHHCLS